MYVVFKRINSPTGEGFAWSELGRVEASSQYEAIRKAVGESPETGIYAASPARSWSPVALKAETTVAVSFASPNGDARAEDTPVETEVAAGNVDQAADI